LAVWTSPHGTSLQRSQDPPKGSVGRSPQEGMGREGVERKWMEIGKGRGGRRERMEDGNGGELFHFSKHSDASVI